MTQPLIFPVGAQVEDYPWEIRFNEDITCNETPCPHCVDDRLVNEKRYDGSTYQLRHWTCPRVVVAYNEGHCNRTAVCLDCIVDRATFHGLIGVKEQA